MNTTLNSFNKGPGATGLQRSTLLMELLTGKAVSTIDARERLGIPHPAGRVSELRLLGHRIVTHTTIVADTSGALHRVALYVLLVGGEA